MPEARPDIARASAVVELLVLLVADIDRFFFFYRIINCIKAIPPGIGGIRAARTPPELDYRISVPSSYKFWMSFNTLSGF
jgi:hypothetical protein